MTVRIILKDALNALLGNKLSKTGDTISGDLNVGPDARVRFDDGFGDKEIYRQTTHKRGTSEGAIYDVTNQYYRVHKDGDIPGTTTPRFEVDVTNNSAKVNGNNIWHTGNDGAGTGLDSDLLDGLHGADFQTRSERNHPEGYAGLSGGKISVSQLPDTVVGGLDYQGTWDAAINTPTLDNAGTGRSKGDYYKVSVDGSTSLSSITDWKIGDWVVWNGSSWDKIDNSEIIPSVFGRTGAISAQAGDYTASQITNTPAGGVAGTDVQAAINELDTEKANISQLPSAASETQQGIVEFATPTETTTGTSTTLATHPAGVKAVADTKAPKAVNTIVDLMALSGSSLQGRIGVSGYYTANDGAALPQYHWNSTDTRAHNGGTIIKPNAVASGSPGRWNLEYNASLNPLWFGAKRDYNGVEGTWTDNQPFFQSLVDYVNANYETRGMTVEVPTGAYGFNSTVDLGEYSRFRFLGGGTHDYWGRNAPSGSMLVACTPGMDLIRANATEPDLNLVDLNIGGPQFYNMNFWTHSNAMYTGRGVVIRLLGEYYFHNCTFREFNDGLVLNSENSNYGGGKTGGDASWGNINHCSFIHNAHAGIYSPYMAGFTVDGCCKFMVTRPDSWGIYVTGGPQVNIIGNKFDGVVGSNTGGVHLGGQYNRVIANQFEVNHPGVRVASLTSHLDDGRGNDVSHNRFLCPGGVTGIDITSSDGKVRETTAIGNVFRYYGGGLTVVDNGDSTVRADHVVGYSTATGGIATAHKSVSAAYTLTDQDATLLVDTLGTARTITLPTAVGRKGRRFTVKKTDSSSAPVTLAAQAAENIDGSNTYTGLATQNDYVAVESTGAHWAIVSRSTTPATSVVGQRCRVTFGATPPTIPNNTSTKVAWDAETVDTNGWHDNVTNNTRITPGAAGTYIVTINISWASSSTGTRSAGLMVNNVRHGGTSMPTVAASADPRGQQVITHTVTLAASDYLEVQVNQGSGGDLTLEATCYMFVTRLS